MKNSIFNAKDYQNLVERLNKLTSNSKNVHGIMSANQMVCHITDPFLDLLKMRETKPALPFFLRPLFKGFLLSEKPWKFGLKTLKLYKQGDDGKGTKPTNFDADKKKLFELAEKFHKLPATFEFGPHGGIGKLNREENGFLMWKHTDHHLKTFDL